jgi:hypothetical protein
MFRKPKPISELMRDPAFPYQVGRLVGASEMASQLLLKQETPDTQTIGVNLANMVAWWFEEGIVKKSEVSG